MAADVTHTEAIGTGMPLLDTRTSSRSSVV